MPDAVPETDTLADLAATAVSDARTRVDDDIGTVLERETRGLQDAGEPVPEDSFRQYVDGLLDDLDELYGVETDEGLRGYLQGRIGYDWSTAEHVKRTGRNSLLAGSMLYGGGAAATGSADVIGHGMEAVHQEPLLGVAGVAAAVGGVAAVEKLTKRIGTGNYVHMPYPIVSHKYRDINISPDPAAAAFAYPVAVSELTHAYQDMWRSPTFDHPYLEEGMDGAAQLAVGDRRQDEPVWAEDSAWRRCHALVHAYGTVASEEAGIEPATLTDVGLTRDEAETAVAIYQDHSSRRTRGLLGAAGLYTAATEHGFDVYADAFDGDYSRLPDWVPGT